MRVHWAALIRLLAPTVIVGGGLLARGYLDQLGDETRIIVANLPYFVAMACLVIAYQFQRLRLLLAAVGTASLFWLIQNYLQVSLGEPDAARLFLVASLGVPLLCAYLLLAPERGLFNTYGLLTAVFFLGLAGLCFVIADGINGADAATRGLFSAKPLEGYILSSGASLLFAAVGFLALVLVIVRDSETEVALAGVLAAGFFSLALLHLDDISVVMGIAGGLSVVWGLLRSSHSMAYRDDLTGLLGRRALNERLNTLGRRYSIAMLDVDHFKKFNDTHGHDVGDDVLKLVASRVKQVGNGGTAYRYGGEEFCVVFPRRSTEDCAAAMDQVRESIANYKMSIRDRKRRPARAKEGSRRRGATKLKSDQVSVTVSAGIAARGDNHPDPESVLSAADTKLYKAKKKGRNCVVY
ncbi:GGDEF domain-containing protein [Seongchinamella unica]|uniref:diguanylate cyclase n=1 Tax=Seongchinamella unica TaxID=2547392 RepID=A0A4V2ZXP4_9GAMM|nr:GGDEF domain-containing protein [Seongchinamella unica]TDG15155.1 GGDEF domain-containing protein [Seongchinamella unica]